MFHNILKEFEEYQERRQLRREQLRRESERRSRKASRDLMVMLAGLLMLMGLVTLWEEYRETNRGIALIGIIFIVLCGITAIALWLRHLKRQQDIDILNTDVRKISVDEAAWRAEKYRDWRQDK
jgi:uncharacterized membrane protein